MVRMISAKSRDGQRRVVEERGVIDDDEVVGQPQDSMTRLMPAGVMSLGYLGDGGEQHPDAGRVV